MRMFLVHPGTCLTLSSVVSLTRRKLKYFLCIFLRKSGFTICGDVLGVFSYVFLGKLTTRPNLENFRGWGMGIRHLQRERTLEVQIPVLSNALFLSVC